LRERNCCILFATYSNRMHSPTIKTIPWSLLASYFDSPMIPIQTLSSYVFYYVSRNRSPACIYAEDWLRERDCCIVFYPWYRIFLEKIFTSLSRKSAAYTELKLYHDNLRHLPDISFVKSTVFWDATPCSLVDKYQSFRTTGCLHLHFLEP
jgi:hypothetical protein